MTLFTDEVISVQDNLHLCHVVCAYCHRDIFLVADQPTVCILSMYYADTTFISLIDWQDKVCMF